MSRIVRLFTRSIRQRMFCGFALVILLVVGMVVAGAFQLVQVQKASDRAMPDVLQTELLQDLALALSSLDADLERFLVVGGQQQHEAVVQDLADMEKAILAMQENRAGRADPVAQELGEAVTGLQQEIEDWLEMASAGPTGREQNERTIHAYAEIERIQRLQRRLSAETVQSLLATVQNQKDTASNIMWQFTIAGGAAALVAIAAALVVTRSIAAPLDSLANTARCIAAGDLEQEAHLEREDEIGDVASAFNTMTARLREQIDGERERRAEVERIMVQEQEQRQALQHILEQVREAVRDLNSASSEVLAATRQQASGANEQSAAITQTTTTVDGVRVIAEQSVKRSGEVADVAQRTVTVSRSGQQAVQDTIDGLEQIKVHVENIAENILTLSEQTQQIGDIITTVNEIASASNMLALNAAVEAARAGEHGKGFAIVAQEVRTLAEQSRQATAQIKALLFDIQQATNATVMATEKGTKGVDAGVRLAAQAQTAITQLAAAIDESSHAALQMVAGGQQQATGIKQIALAMSNIHQATTQSLTSTHQAEKAAQGLNELAHRLTEAAEKYRL